MLDAPMDSCGEKAKMEGSRKGKGDIRSHFPFDTTGDLCAYKNKSFPFYILPSLILFSALADVPWKVFFLEKFDPGRGQDHTTFVDPQRD